MLDGIVTVGNLTDHNGVVLEGFPGTDLNGRPITERDHMESRPTCQIVFLIIDMQRLQHQQMAYP